MVGRLESVQILADYNTLSDSRVVVTTVEARGSLVGEITANQLISDWVHNYRK